MSEPSDNETLSRFTWRAAIAGAAITGTLIGLGWLFCKKRNPNVRTRYKARIHFLETKIQLLSSQSGTEEQVAALREVCDELKSDLEKYRDSHLEALENVRQAEMNLRLRTPGAS